MMSLWANCWRGEYEFLEWGTRFEIGRKEKKARR